MYKGEAYRVRTMFQKEVSAADIVRYEQSAPGNKLYISDEFMSELERRDARDLIWVTRTREGAEEYGAGVCDVSDVVSGGIIVREMPDGVLVLKKRTEGQVAICLNDLAGSVVSIALDAGCLSYIQGVLEREESVRSGYRYRVTVTGKGMSCAEVNFTAGDVSDITSGDIIHL